MDEPTHASERSPSPTLGVAISTRRNASPRSRSTRRRTPVTAALLCLATACSSSSAHNDAAADTGVDAQASAVLDLDLPYVIDQYNERDNQTLLMQQSGALVDALFHPPMPNPTFCTSDQQYYAWPSRRIVEVARRFDQAPWCNDRPCRNGYVASICTNDDSVAVSAFVSVVQRRLVAM